MGGSRTNTLAGRRSFNASLTTKIDSLIYHLLNKFSITLKFMRSSNRKNSVTSYVVLFFSNQNAFVAVECLITLKTIHCFVYLQKFSTLCISRDISCKMFYRLLFFVIIF